MASRQIKMPAKDGSEKEIEEVFHNARGQSPVDICYR
jgi:hypothetical protein